MVPGNKATWRASRDSAVKSFNEIAGSLGVDHLQPRPSSAQITELWSALCEVAEPHQYEDLKGARDMWVANHGDGDLTENPAAVDANDVEQASDLLEVHRTLCDGTPAQCSKEERVSFEVKGIHVDLQLREVLWRCEHLGDVHGMGSRESQGCPRYTVECRHGEVFALSR